jgi:hypothetical protein
MERTLGRIQACHPQVADLYEMRIEENGQGTRLVWRQKPEQQQWLEAREGAYLLRANLKADSPLELWKQYMQLTEVEAAFRTLKSELAIRPLFHQLERRVKAHVLVAFLGYEPAGDAEASSETECFGILARRSPQISSDIALCRHRTANDRRK